LHPTGEERPGDQSTQPGDRPGESAPDQGLVWPPPDADLDFYSLPPDSIAARQAHASQSSEPTASVEESSDVWPPLASDPVVTPWVPAHQIAAPEVWPPEPAIAPLESAITPPEPVVMPPERVVAPSTPSPLPLLLSHVLQNNVGFHWHEGVAIVRQLADQLTHGLSLEPQGSVPGIDGIELEPTGRVRARLDPAGTVPVVRGLGYLLHVLLADTGAPVRLRLIVSQAVSEVPAFPSVERLTWELAGFERPRRLETLKQLYERTAEARRAPLVVPAASGPDVPARSRPVPSRPVAHAAEGEDERTTQRPRLPWPAFALVLVAGAVCGALFFAAVTARSPGREAAPTPRAVAESTTRDLESVVPDASQRRTDAAPADPVQPAAPSSISPSTISPSSMSPSRARDRPQNEPAVRLAMKPVAATHETAPPPIGELARLGPALAPRSSLREVPQRVQREYRRARALFDEKDYAKAADGFLQVVRLLDDGELTAAAGELRSMASDYAALSRATLSAMTRGPVYTSGDEGVTEPVALRLYLPDPAPGTPPSRLGVLSLVVDGEGAVESVRLQSPSNRYHDRFWVSAAKTWRFRPALKDGRPVKFLKRIMITEPPLSDPQ
jgi:hypothetical protein